MARLALTLLGLSGAAARAQTITEYPGGLGAGAHPFEIAAGPDGNLWFTESGDRIGRITPLGVVSQFGGVTAGGNPRSIAAGPDGAVWFTEVTGNRIGRIAPDGGVVEFAAGITPVAQPLGITTGPDGNLWFTEINLGRIGRITPAGQVTEFGAGISSAALPVGITSGADGNLWFTEVGTDKIGRITPAGEVTEFHAGITAGSGPVGITSGPDGNIWFTEFSGAGIGRITLEGVVTEFRAGITADSLPTDIVTGPDGNLWFTEAIGDRIGRITPAGVVTEFDAGITRGAGPHGIALGSDGNLWFTEPDGDRIARAVVGSRVLLPSAAHAPGANGAFYTTDVSMSNAGDDIAFFTLKFLGSDRDGSNGPEEFFFLVPGESRTFVDVLGSVFHQTNAFGAVLITSSTPPLDVVSVTATAGLGGTFGTTIPAAASPDLAPAGSPRSILYVREGDGFRSNLVIASGAPVPTSVDVALVSPAGATLAARAYSVPANGMTQINRVVRDMGVSGAVTGARLVLSSSTPGAAFAGLVSVIDETTNDPIAVTTPPAPASGAPPYSWLLPASAHASGANGAFYTTNLAVANVGSDRASFTLKFLGHDQDGSSGPEQTRELGPGETANYFDVLGSVFGLASGFGAIRITSSSPTLHVVSVVSTPGFGGTFGQSIRAVPSADLVRPGVWRSLLGVREGDGFRTNLVLASGAGVASTVEANLISPAGVLLATKRYPVPPNGMTQINRVVRDMGVSVPVTRAHLVLYSPTLGAAFTALASVIDEATNDAATVEAK